ncbi:MAG TPA: CoA transferase [Vineibacter sp.]|nr:CoA transferase [Vineibacter sp.]
MLEDIRVLELSGPFTMMAGQILADLGAEVVAIEPPEGARGRRMEPFLDDVPGLDRSLTWQALNRNKRGMTLRTDSADGRTLLEQLAHTVDIILEELPPGGTSVLAGCGLPQTLIHAQITSFSKDGPKAHYRSSDLALMAASGAPALAGEPGRPPLFFPVPQAMMEAGAESAVAALAALAARDCDGRGQAADVSARTAAIASGLSRVIAGFAGDTLPVRSATTGAGLSGVRSVPGMYTCADGYMVMSIVFGAAFLPMTRQMVKWAIDEGELAPEYADAAWQAFGRSAAASPASRAPIDALVDAVSRLCRTRTKQQLAATARAYKFMAAPVNTMADIAASPQFRERGLFTSTTVSPDGRAIDIPARFIQFSDYSIETRRPAPRLSEHSMEILSGDLGLSGAEIQALFVHGVI